MDDALKRKGSVHDANAAYVQQLRVASDASDEEIQSALTRLFRKQSDSNEVQGKSVLKISTQSSSQQTEQLLDQINPRPSRPSEQTEISTVDRDQVEDSKTKISVLRSGVIIDSSLRENINSLLKKESPYMEIIEELENGKKEIKKERCIKRKWIVGDTSGDTG